MYDTPIWTKDEVAITPAQENELADCKNQCDSDASCKAFEMKVIALGDDPACTLHYEDSMEGDGNDASASLCYNKIIDDTIVESANYDLVQQRSYCVNHVDVGAETEEKAESIEMCADYS